MEKILGNVYNVRKGFSTAKSIQVGEYKTADEAINAMLEHYKTNPKRGNFTYTISDSELREIGGIVYRTSILSLCEADKQFYHKYNKIELDAMTA